MDKSVQVLDDNETLEGLGEPVAIIGFSSKFPREATDSTSFWKMMSAKKCASLDFPADRLNIDAFYQPDMEQFGTIPFKGGRFLKEDISLFDAEFFSIPASEAPAMGPAQRLLLETVYHAFESAGLTLETLRKSDTSVHTGCFTDDDKTPLWKDLERVPKYASTSTSFSILANRLS